MKCNNCYTKLNPYLIEQIYDEDHIEVRCGHCRESNFISLETYLYLKKDWIMPTIKPIDNKLPKDMNVIILSTERCGISWIVKVISQIHENMFGVPIDCNYEISRLEAKKKHLPLPKGWNTVYNVASQKIVDRDYDRVLIIKRDLEELLKAQMLYSRWELVNGIDNMTEERLISKITRYWKLVYEKEINDPKCLTIRLEDLNRYTVNTFNEILDFLNFPSFFRPVLIPIIPPDRNWEAYSSILPKGHKLFPRLQEINEAYKK